MKHVVPVLGGMGVLLAAAAQPAQAASADGPLRAVQAMTAKYPDVERALADGFVPTEDCVEVAGLGGMGYHYVNPEWIDERLVPGRPEVLLYAVDEAGNLVLTGVEYLVVDADQDPMTDDDRPVLRGHEFEGPMPGHGPGMPVHYDLHVWAHTTNPSGAWATWNPAITCP